MSTNIPPEAPPPGGLFSGVDAAPAPAPPSLLAQLDGIFFQPVALFRDLYRAPAWLGATLLMAVLTLAATTIWAMRVDVDAMLRPSLEANASVDPGQIDRIISVQAKLLPLFAPIGTIVAISLLTFLPALLFYWLANLYGEGETTYRHALAATAVPNLVMLPMQAALVAIVALRHIGGAKLEELLPLSVGYFVHPENVKAAALLRQVNPFVIAVYVMTYLALRHTLRLKPAAAWSGTLLCAAAAIAFRVLAAR
jgi:hypothetical protein